MKTLKDRRGLLHRIFMCIFKKTPKTPEEARLESIKEFDKMIEIFKKPRIKMTKDGE